MKPNSVHQIRRYSFKCAVCSRSCQYFYYGVKCCEACKHFFRRSISLMKDYNCKNDEQCNAIKDQKCKRCRLKRCLSVGMNPRGVCTNKICGNDILAFVERFKQLDNEKSKLHNSIGQTNVQIGMELALAPNNGANSGPSKWAEPDSILAQKNFAGFILLKHLLEIEQKVRKIRDSQTQVPEFFYDQCKSFEAIFGRKLNLLECSTKFSPKLPSPPPAPFYEAIRQYGPFCERPPYLAMDLLFVFEIAKTFPFFERISNNDKIALCSNIAMPLFTLCNGFYSAQQNSDVFCTPQGIMPIKLLENSYYNEDANVMGLADEVLRKAMEPFVRLKMSTEEFVLLRAVIYAQMVSPGLSEQAQKLLQTEAQKFSSLLMNILQINFGSEAGLRRYAELIALVEFAFNSGAKHRQMLTYVSYLLDPHFDLVMPQALAKVCTKGPAELNQINQSMLPFPFICL